MMLVCPLASTTKRHGSVTALHDVSIEIRPGEFFALLGPSGSGKTTTLRILAGLEPHEAGRVWLDGVDVTAREPGERDVAMVFQSYALYPHMTVAENIGFPLRMIGTAQEKASVVSFVLDCAHPHDIGTILDQQGIAVRAGHHCAQPVMKRFNVPATARASFAFYNTKAEADALADAVEKVIEVFS